MHFYSLLVNYCFLLNTNCERKNEKIYKRWEKLRTKNNRNSLKRNKCTQNNKVI